MSPLQRWLFMAVFILSADAALVAIGCDSANCTCHQVTHAYQSRCWWASTGSFRVCSFKSANEAEQVARHCEKLRSELADLYSFETDKQKWQPRCEVFLHSSKRKYGAIVGRAAMETLGSSLVTPETGSIKSRRIDLRTDVAGYLQKVLPHELTHILIADHFREGAPPLWYDEGLALLADPPSKLALHGDDLRNGLERGIAYSLEDLLAAKQYPPAERVSVFYGQCASLAHFLTEHRGSVKVHAFARRAQEVVANLALKETYGIRGVAELELMWLDNVNSHPNGNAARHSLH
ncbi:hypothetical protein [Aeoliella sp. SH292]|uniref:hypothetical protein n=1 Tax=Aeoliella sp. SH292 TaxID=3454464 RepID=UPI003F98432B